MSRKAQEHGVEFVEPGTGAREAAEAHLATVFEVSADVIHKHVELDELWIVK